MMRCIGVETSRSPKIWSIRDASPIKPWPRRQPLSLAWAGRPTLDTEVPRLNPAVDDELSKRPLELDAAGYFIIKLDCDAKEIIAEYFTNIINQNGLACDPETGEVIPCTPGYVRKATRVYRGKTAKDISVQIIEHNNQSTPACTRLEHANYLGREFQRAELALLMGQDYVQD